MNLRIGEPFQAELQSKAAERGLTVENYIEQLVADDPRQNEPPDRSIELLESLQLNHGKSFGKTYNQMELQSDLANRVRRLALAHKTTEQDYLQHRLNLGQ